MGDGIQVYLMCDRSRQQIVILTKVMEILAMSKQTTHSVHKEKFNLKKLNEVECKEQCHVDISNSFAALENIDTEVDIIELGKVLEYHNFSQDSLGCYELKKHK
jgi:hypothetical protein